jgi:para-nitrobenzyl esterase
MKTETRNKLIVAIWLILAASVPASAADSGPVVAVTGGRIRGAALPNSGAVFKSIPFAAPPVGDLRWREPMPIKPWSGVRDATNFGAPCAQNPYFIPKAKEVSSEDCLFLNIWSPEWPSKSRKPVMVWIPGGGNFGGASGIGVNNGENLSRHGVVVVTINYRLGLFGFFAHPELTRESPHRASGNQGILDQIAALRWVRQNIAKFGGDPANVTIFGESAGSLDVSVLMTSPLSKGLFGRVIGESGAVIMPMADNGSSVLNRDPLPLQEAESLGQIFSAKWTSGDASLKAMRAVSTADILKMEPNFVQLSPQYLGIIVDGYIFPKRPVDIFAAGREHRVALLLGNNSRERTPGTTPPSDLTKAVEDGYGPIAKQALAIYVGAADPQYGTPADQWATDTSFRCSAVLQLMWHATAGNAAFEFQFDRAAPGRESIGATHTSELEYVFNTFGTFATPGTPVARYDTVDHSLSDDMQQYWTNFAKTGNPSGVKLPQWPKFDPVSRAYMEFTDAGPVTREALRRPFCDLFIENVKRRMAK